MGNRVYKYVAVIGIDGMGSFCDKTSTPNFDRIFKNGCRTTDALSMAPTISAQNWGAMILGAKPNVHRITNENISLSRYSNSLLPSVFKRIREAFPDALLCSYSNWSPINVGLIEENAVVQTDTDRDDKVLCGKIVECVKQKPDFLFVQFDNVDGAGHKYTYGSDEHLEMIRHEDEFVGQIYDEYRNQDMIDDTLFMVITDHGGYKTGHGGFTDSEKYIFFAAAGKTVRKNSKPDFMQTRDISAIVLYAFGIEVPEYDTDGYSSQVPEGIFDGYNKPYYKIIAKPFIPETKETPELDGENGLYGFFDRGNVEFVLNFDYSADDKTHKHTVEHFGLIKYYANGILGSYAELGATGFAKVDEKKLAKRNFTLAFWIKMNNGCTDAVPVVSTKGWECCARKDPGFSICRCSEGMLVHLGHECPWFEFITPYPEDVSDGWVHTALSFDYDKKELRCYFNFKLENKVNVPKQYFENLVAGEITIGNDCGSFNNGYRKHLVSVDDVIMFNNALDKDEIKKLGEYYNYKNNNINEV